MTTDQAVVFAVLALTLALFVWGRWRYDVVAMLALLAVVLSGVLPAEDAFTGFAHPAVITVAAVLVISRALEHAGLIDAVVRLLGPLEGKPVAQIMTQTALVAVLSAFMNNVGALALMLPVALRQAYRDGYAPAMALMPLAFGSILGGLTTLIGTPPNLIVSSYRQEVLGEPYGMFAFAPVGGPVALVGVAFVALIGWRLIPKDRRGAPDPEKIFSLADYVTEVRVPEESKIVGKRLSDIEALTEDDVTVVAIVQEEKRRLAPRPYETVRGGDVLVLEASAAVLEEVLDATDLELVEAQEISRDDLKNDEVSVLEAIVPPGSGIVGRTPTDARLRDMHGVNLLAVARHGQRVRERLSRVRLRSGDVLMLQGPTEKTSEVLSRFGLLPLAGRGISVARPRRLALTGALFAAAVVAVVAGWLPPHVAFAAAAVAMVLAKVLSRDEPYAAIDWPVIVLLGAMIPVGTAMEITGGTALVADGLLALTGGLGPLGVMVALMVGTMLLSDVVNNNATAVLMAPLAIDLARRLEVNPDPLLMAVAIGASCAFLTPIGHQSNTLVFEPGGYRFSDFARLGVPLEVIIVAVATPLLVVFWPF